MKKTLVLLFLSITVTSGFAQEEVLQETLLGLLAEAQLRMEQRDDLSLSAQYWHQLAREIEEPHLGASVQGSPMGGMGGLGDARLTGLRLGRARIDFSGQASFLSLPSSLLVVPYDDPEPPSYFLLKAGIGVEWDRIFFAGLRLTGLQEIRPEGGSFWPVLDDSLYHFTGITLGVSSVNTLLRRLRLPELPSGRLFDGDRMSLQYSFNMGRELEYYNSGFLFYTGFKFVPFVKVKHSQFLNDLTVRSLLEVPMEMNWWVRPQVEFDISLLKPHLRSLDLRFDVWNLVMDILTQSDYDPGLYGITRNKQSFIDVAYGPVISWRPGNASSYPEIYPVDPQGYFNQRGLAGGFHSSISAIAEGKKLHWGITFNAEILMTGVTELRMGMAFFTTY